MARYEVNQEMLAQDFESLQSVKEKEFEARKEEIPAKVETILNKRLENIKAEITAELEKEVIDEINAKYTMIESILSKYVKKIEEEV